MTSVPLDAELDAGQFAQPVLWLAKPTIDVSRIDTSDEVMDYFLGEGAGNAIKSFGHDPITGVHFLLTRKGTTVHTDKAYLRYTHQLVLRNDGNRVRGLPRYDHQENWHEPMEPGTLYCLDTHSPHQGIADTRFPKRAQLRGMKAVIAVDRNVPLDPEEALALLRPWVDRATQLRSVPYDADAKTFKKWKEPTR